MIDRIAEIEDSVGPLNYLTVEHWTTPGDREGFYVLDIFDTENWSNVEVDSGPLREFAEQILSHLDKEAGTCEPKAIADDRDAS